jgi:transposase
MSRLYDTDLSDAAWVIIEPQLPAALPGGRPRTTDLRAVVNTDLFADEETTYLDDVDQFLALQKQAVNVMAEERRKAVRPRRSLRIVMRRSTTNTCRWLVPDSLREQAPQPSAASAAHTESNGVCVFRVGITLADRLRFDPTDASRRLSRALLTVPKRSAGAIGGMPSNGWTTVRIPPVTQASFHH